MWAAIEPLIPRLVEAHPLGYHRPRSSDRDCFDVILVWLATGCSWENAERLCGNKASDTPVRARRDDWLSAGVFDAIAKQAEEAYDRVIGLDLSDVALDGPLHKSSGGGEGTGKNSTDRGKRNRWSNKTELAPHIWQVPDSAERHFASEVAFTPSSAKGRAPGGGT